MLSPVTASVFSIVKEEASRTIEDDDCAAANVHMQQNANIIDQDMKQFFISFC
jgi:hypothetical protein